MTERLDTPQGRSLAVMREGGQGPAVLFLGGYGSDMTGTKAAWLADWARGRGRAFARFDYSGHGQSAGAFEEGSIGDWLADAEAVLATLPRPVVLVGSSMGGWLALLLARARPDEVAALVTVAAAPDFTEEAWETAPEAARARLMAEGRLALEGGSVVTRRLVEEARDRLVLRAPLHLPMPVRLLQGTADREVPASLALRLLDHATGPDIRLTLVKDADHRFSSPRCLKLLGATLDDLGG